MTHGLTEEAEALREKLEGNVPDLSTNKAELMMTATPVMRLHETNWPLLNVSSGPSFSLESGKFTAADDDSELGAWPSGGDGDALNIPGESSGVAGGDPFANSDEELPTDAWGIYI